LFRGIDETAYSIAKLYGYAEIDTPIFEFSDVFHRSLGDTSDMVSKETYSFQDRGGDSITLRPEGTAGVVRAFISNGLAQNLPLKFYYSGPMFRYERPRPTTTPGCHAPSSCPPSRASPRLYKLPDR
jgi:histidyl-tRNA synthetase